MELADALQVIAESPCIYMCRAPRDCTHTRCRLRSRGLLSGRNVEALQVVGEGDGTCVRTFDRSEGFGLMAQRPQHTMGEDQCPDFGVVRDLADDGWRHVQSSLDACGAFGYGIVCNENVRVMGQSI